jgi:hypothetical protein
MKILYFRFLGLPPVKVVQESGNHETLPVVPLNHQINEEYRQKAIEFLEPFNVLLYQYVKELYNIVSNTTETIEYL